MTENPFTSPTPPPPVTDADVPQLAPPQSVTVTLEAADYMAFVNDVNTSHHALRRYLWKRIAKNLLIGGAMLAFSFVYGPQGINAPTVEGMIRVLGIIFLLSAILQWPLQRWRSRRQVRLNIRLGLYGAVDESATHTLDDVGVRIRDHGGEALRYWSAVERVAATDDYLFLYLQPMQAAILPLRAFQSEAQFRGFIDLANRLWSAAQNESTNDSQ